MAIKCRVRSQCRYGDTDFTFDSARQICRDPAGPAVVEHAIGRRPPSPDRCNRGARGGPEAWPADAPRVPSTGVCKRPRGCPFLELELPGIRRMREARRRTPPSPRGRRGEIRH
ncbi:hypothetical protein HPB48_002144 [Haemaphysalis longicornis]|uniref:Uncharacterized protein n=1 Tax=Haemaphysalis longicornis TaxID=44386 RepID=A0A9J6F7M6_HAELO|nr:hypothetical protein HPB48_002144 [Haemaphysalis longicornis]